MRRTVKSLLGPRAGNLQVLGPDHTVREAVSLMNRKNIGAILVMNPDDELLGVFTERDVLRRVLEDRLDPDATALEAVMTREVFWIGPEGTVEDAMALVNEHNVRHLPVMDEAQVLGMISVRDLTAAVVENRELELADLTSYVHGSYGGHVQR
ncbi:MAG: CBS domain-containing protein [Spiribacter sp.]|nr:CBS domain-containing protein [Spiribacter sp.]MDR9454876.1 CBS domain-containing protein [Spiribacter sp.]